MNQKISFKDRLFTLLPLFLVTLICVGLVSFVNQLTKDKIQENKQRADLSIIKDVILDNYDNDLLLDKIALDVPAFINKTKTVSVYRARLNNQPVGVALMPITTKGYNGEIKLLVGIAYDGSIRGIKVISHHETEGFGDQVHQDNTDWLTIFSKKNIETTPEKKWALKKDGGEFDQLSGATITSRSVVNAIYPLLSYYSEHKNDFYQ